MQIVQGSLVIIGADTKTPNVLLNGVSVAGLVDVKVNFSGKVTLKVKNANMNDQVVQDLIAGGIVVKGVQ